MLLICYCFAFFCLTLVDPQEQIPSEPPPSPKHRSIIAHTPGDKVYDIAIMIDTSADMKNLESTKAFRGVQNWLHEFPNSDKEPDETETYFASVLCDSGWLSRNQFSKKMSPKSIDINKIFVLRSNASSKSFADCFKSVMDKIFNTTKGDRPNVPDVIIYLSSCSESMTVPEMSKFKFMVICMPGLPGFGTNILDWSKKVEIKNAHYFVYSNIKDFRKQLDKILGIPTWIVDCECGKYDKLKCEWKSNNCSLVGKCVKITRYASHRLSKDCPWLRDGILSNDTGYICDDKCQMLQTPHATNLAGIQSTDSLVIGICAIFTFDVFVILFM